MQPYARVVHWVILFLFICSLPAVFFTTFKTPQNSKAVDVTYDFPRWEWANPTPTGNNLKSVTTCPDGTVYVVGDAGTILKSTDSGTNWKREYSGVTVTFNSIECVSSDNVIAVGDGGTILKYNGVSWSSQTSGTTNVLRGVSAFDTSNVWAVGDAGTILKYNGVFWSSESSGTTNMLRSVSALDTSNVWAVGVGKILKYNGNSWSSQSLGIIANFSSVSAFDASNVWAVGDGGTILKYNGTSWSSQESGTTEWLTSVSALDTSNVWAVGGGKIFKYDGVSWSLQLSDPTNQLLGVSALDANNVWAVGGGGKILKYNGTSWSSQESGTTEWLTSVSAFDASNVWVVGDGGTILKYNGTSWSSQESSTTDAFSGVSAFDTNNVWAVDYSGTILKYNGTSWSPQTSGIANGFSGVSVLDANNVWASAFDGTIFKYNGVSWSPQTSGTTNVLSGVSALDATNVWAVGDVGTIMRYTSPANSTATKLLIQVDGQNNFVDEDMNGVTGSASTAVAGVPYQVITYAVDDNNKIDHGIPYQVAFTTTDPADTNPALIYLENGISIGTDACNSGTDERRSSPCGVGSSDVTFHTPGTWTVTATDTNGILTAGPSSQITVLPGVANHATFLPSPISTHAGVAKVVTLGLADLNGYPTSDPSGKKISLISKNALGTSVGLFSASDTGPWTQTLEITVPAGNPAIPVGDNKTVNFYYLDFAPTSSTITASADGLTPSTLPVTITEGTVTDSNISVSNSNPKAGETVVVTVNITTTTSNPDILLYSSRSEDTITRTSNSGGTATFNLYSEKAGALTLSAKDDTDSTWLAQQPVVNFVHNSVYKVGLPTSVSKDIVAGQIFNLTASFSDRFNNPATNSSDKISLSSNDDQAALSATANLDPANNPGSYVFNQISLKSAGERIVTVKDETTGASGQITFIVYASLPSVSASLFETTKNILILNKETANLTITIFDPYKNPIYNKTTKIQNDASLGLIDSPEKQTDSAGQSKYIYTPLKEGKDTLTAFMPDNNDPTKNVAFSQSIVIDNRPDTLVNNIASTIDSLQNNPIAQAIANIAEKVTQVTVALGLIPFLANLVGGIPAALHAVNYGFSLTMEALGIKRKRKSWGRVYDSTTGKGIDTAMIRLYDQKEMMLRGTMITDIKGKYYFSADPGVYAISVSKDGYIFPTEIFAKYGIQSFNKNASRINTQYVGQPINIDDKTNYLNIDVPMDPVKPNISTLFKIKIFGSDLLNYFVVGLPYIVIPALIIGSLLSIFTAVVKPTNYNIILSAVYVALTLGYILSRYLKSAHAGMVLDKTTKKPIFGVMISLFEKEHNNLKETRITDRYGRFSINAPKGLYYLKAQKSGYEFAFSGQKDKNIILKEEDYIRETIEGHKK